MTCLKPFIGSKIRARGIKPNETLLGDFAAPTIYGLGYPNRLALCDIVSNKAQNPIDLIIEPVPHQIFESCFFFVLYVSPKRFIDYLTTDITQRPIKRRNSLSF